MIRTVMTMLVAVLALAASRSAGAQDFMGMVDAYGQAHVNMLHGQIMSDATRRRTQLARQHRPQADPRPAASGAPPRTAASRSPATLTFRPSAAVTADVHVRLTETLSGAMAQGRSPAEFRRLLDSGDLQRGFREIVGKYGFSDRDLADVLAAHLVMSWQVANDVAELDEPRGNAAVRAGLRDALASADWVRTLGDAQKQALAETLVIGTMLNVTRYIHGKQSGDAKLVATARADADAMTRSAVGINLRDYRMTPAGLRPN